MTRTVHSSRTTVLHTDHESR